MLGRHPWSSPWSVWARKVGLIPPDEPGDESEAQWFGRALEAVTARRFREETGLEVGGEQMMLTRPGQPWARATVDGLVFEHADEQLGVDDAIGVLELKYTSEPPWETLPEHHALQVQWQLYVSGLGHGWLAAFHLAFGRPAFRLYEVEADLDLQRRIVGEVERFWHEHVVAGEAPPIDGSDATTAALKAVYREPVEGASVDLDDDLDATTALEDLRALKRYAKDVADDIATAENTLRLALGDATEGRLGGFVAVSWRPQRTTRVDPVLARALIADAADVTTTSRVLRLHKGKP